jgi:hypothetical protein
MESYKSILGMDVPPHLLVLWLSWFLYFSQVVGASSFLRCHEANLCYGTATVLATAVESVIRRLPKSSYPAGKNP